MLDCQVAIMENAFMRYFTLGQTPQRLGTRHPSSTPFQAFDTSDGQVVVAIMGGSTDQWPLFCAAIDHVELIDDDRYLTGWGRTQHYEELIPVIEAAIRQRTTAEWVEILSEMGVPAGPVQDIAQVAADPQIAHRGMFVELDHPALGPTMFTGNPMKLSRTPGAPPRLPPNLGEHSAEVLAELLGLSGEQLDDLFAEQVHRLMLGVALAVLSVVVVQPEWRDVRAGALPSRPRRPARSSPSSSASRCSCSRPW